MLYPLANNGGQTDTHALRPGSAAIDRGGNPNNSTTDQRGISRTLDGDGDGAAQIDIGAFEYEPPSSLVVTNTNDAGAGSLRQAIIDSNNSTASSSGSRITFDIPGSGVRTINLASPLPAVTRAAEIDGYTQPGATVNTATSAATNAVVLVEINGAGAGGLSDGLVINAAKSRVAGLAVNRFPSAGIRVANTAYVSVEGNFLGTDAAGSVARPNTRGGVIIENSSDCSVGGAAARQRNVLSGNRSAGAILLNATASRIQGNLIGTAADGATALGNTVYFPQIGEIGAGVDINNGANNVIGGASAGEGNLIAYNAGSGVVGRNTGNGTGTGAGALNNLIRGNVIRNNGASGIRLLSGTGNSFLDNSIYDNAELGIDLNGDGITPNNLFVTTGPNNYQTFPVVQSAAYGSGTATVTITLESRSARSYTLEIFASDSCDASGNGEGRSRIQTFTGTSNPSGSLGRVLTFAVPQDLTGKFITATATDTASGDTSEFSACRVVNQNNSVVFSAANYRRGESAANAFVSVERIAPNAGGASVQISTASGGTATSGASCDGTADYITKTQTLTWGENDNSTKEFFFPLCADDRFGEGDETVNLALSNPSNVNLGIQNTATLTIIEDDLLVTNTNASGAGSLRQAFLDANTNRQPENSQPYVSRINFAAGVAGTISLESALPTLDGEVYINGPGAKILTIDGANNTPGVIANARTAYINDLSITGGDGGTYSGEGMGAGIYNTGTLEITRCRIYNNGGIFEANTGGIFHRNGVLRVTDSTIDGNRFGGDGFNGRGAAGAGVNIVSDGGATAVAVFRNSTISDNRATLGAGGIKAETSGANSLISLTLENTTVAGNTTGDDSPGALRVAGAANSVSVSLSGTLVADNDAPQFTLATGNAVASNGNNLDADGTSGLTNGAGGNIVGTTGAPINALLARLADNGGQTPTRALKAGSPAIDKGAANGNLPNDQRGLTRTTDGDNDGTNAPDIGAFELQKIVVTNAADAGAGSLRQAILDNNQTGAALIAFNISGSGTRTINLASPLPDLTRAVQIDATTQPGYTTGVPAVALDGTNAGGAASGLNVIAADTLVRGLEIRNFAADGIGVGAVSRGTRFAHNSIHDNGDLGIDLENDGVTANDAGDADDGANRRQNFPVLLTATEGTRVTGTLDSTPNSRFVLQFYASPVCDPSGNGEGQTFVGELTQTTDAAGALNFDRTFTGASFAGQFITATATNDATGDTSEFSACKQIESSNRFYFSSPTYIYSETNSAAAVATVRRAGAAATLGAASVEVLTVANGTASGSQNCAVGADFIVRSQTLSWAAGDNADKTVEILICPDTIPDPDETFGLVLANPTGGASLGAPSTAVATILDDDYEVTNNNDSGAGSLRAAVEAANAQAGSGTISFAANVVGTIDLLTALPALADDVTINGPGAKFLNVRRSVAPNTPDFTVFVVETGKSVTISGLTVSNGRGAAAGGIYNSGTLVLRGVAVDGNTSIGGSSVEVRAGGIANFGTLTASNCTISNNSISESGGTGNAAGLLNWGDNRTVSAALINCTISGNSVNTESYNSASAIISGRVNGGTAALTFNSCTIARNNSTATTGSVSGVFLFNTSLAASNSVFFANQSKNFASSRNAGIFNSLGYNFDSDGTSGWTNGTNGDIVGTAATPRDPLIGILADNGGSTLTHALLDGSPLIDKGNRFSLTTDQRGALRPVDIAGITNASDGADIGAFEQQNIAATGIEADVVSRPSGDGAVRSDDIVQIRRFLNRSLSFDNSTNEFQRADSAPYATNGDGVIASDDVVQARRYQNGTYSPQAASGPMFSNSARSEDQSSELAAMAGRALRVENAAGSRASQVTVNIRVDSTGDEAEYGFTLNYDPNVLGNPVVGTSDVGASVRSCAIAPAGSFNCSIGGFPNNAAGSADPGIGEIAAVNNQILLRVTFTVAANAAFGDTNLTLSNANASTDAPTLFNLATTGGTLTVTAPTAAAVSISGQVISPSRSGLTNALVTLTDARGDTRTVLTGRFGAYRFADVAAGETYIISVTSKRYVYAPQVITVTEDLTEVNFTPTQ